MKVYILSFSNGKVTSLANHQSWNSSAVFSTFEGAMRVATLYNYSFSEWREFNGGKKHCTLYEYAEGHTAALMISEHTVDEYAQE